MTDNIAPRSTSKSAALAIMPSAGLVLSTPAKSKITASIIRPSTAWSGFVSMGSTGTRPKLSVRALAAVRLASG